MKAKNLFTVLALAVTLTACGANTDTKENENVDDSKKIESKVEEGNEKNQENEKSVIYTSFFPIYNLAKQIAGDKFEVRSFTNLKTESHGFEPSAKEIAELSNAKLMFTNGAGMEEWEEKVKESTDVEFVNTTEGIDLIKATEEDHEEADHDHEDHDHEEGHHHHHHGEYDPHTWLNPANGKAQAKVIADKLSEIDPANKDYYMANYEKIATELDEITSEYKDKFANVENNKFIVPHQAFGYVAREFNLEQIPLNSLTSTGEAGSKVLKEVSDMAKDEKIKTVFYEMGGSDKAAKTLADEIDAEAKPISTLEFATDEELDTNKTYQEMIKENLEAIYQSLS